MLREGARGRRHCQPGGAGGGGGHEDGRQILAVELADRECRSSWRDFLSGLKERGLAGVEFVVSANHEGLKAAIREVLPQAAWRGAPGAIRVDNGPEFVSKVLDRWANSNNVTLDFLRPGKPTDNAFVTIGSRRLSHQVGKRRFERGVAAVEGKPTLALTLGRGGYDGQPNLSHRRCGIVLFTAAI